MGRLESSWKYKHEVGYAFSGWGFLWVSCARDRVGRNVWWDGQSNGGNLMKWMLNFCVRSSDLTVKLVIKVMVIKTEQLYIQ